MSTSNAAERAISDALKAELERRFAEMAANPSANRPWEEVKRRLLGENDAASERCDSLN